jgi:hypothetical protein
MKTPAERTQYIGQRKRPTNRRERLWVRDDWTDMEVFEVPVDALVLNADNRRFRAERMWAEHQLGRSLDPENNPDDERSIESLLLDTSHRVEVERITGSPSSDYESLRNDWERRRQERPIWIRPDGTVRNGNRRLAMIKRMQREGGDVGLQWVDAVILDPADIDEPVLLEMEQREQLTENFKVRYNDIDYLLALREAAEHRDVDWFVRDSIDEVAGELQSMVEKTKAEVVRDLFAIKYMDQFLEDSGQPGEYHRMLRTLERFRDIGRTMMRVEDEYPLEADRILQVLFAAVRAGLPHGDIRSIRTMLRDDRDRFDELASNIATAETDWDSTGDATVAAPVAPAPILDDDELEEETEGPGPDVPNYPKSDVSSAIKMAIDGFDASRQDDLIQTLREVRNRLDVLAERDRLRRAFEDPGLYDGLRAEVAAVVAWADQHRDLAASR